MTPVAFGFPGFGDPLQKRDAGSVVDGARKMKKCRARLTRRAYGARTALQGAADRSVEAIATIVLGASVGKLCEQRRVSTKKPNNFGFAQIDLALKAKLPKYA
jgi:hypothetical protein